MESSSKLPLHLCHVHKLSIFINRTHIFFHSIALVFLLYYRASFFFFQDTTKTKATTLAWLLVFVSEILLSFEWLLSQSFRWRPVSRTAFPERLPGDDKLPAVDVFICTADPEKEPTVGVMNTVLSAMAMDYPPEKLHVYLSDDGGAAVTLKGMREAWRFAKWWLPFCRRYGIKCRAPEAYFSAEEEDADFGGSEFIQDREDIKEIYEAFKKRVREKATVGDTRSGPSRDHPAVIEVIQETSSDDAIQENETKNMPLLVYVSREKRPSHFHNFKAGALNVLLRVSGVISNSPYILGLDCDMHCHDPSSARQAMCFHLDPNISPSLAFVQFPQKFHNISNNDIYDSQLRSIFWLLWQGFDGVGGPGVCGTGYYIKRLSLCSSSIHEGHTSQWVIGNGSHVDFWTDNWMGDSLMHLLGIPPSVAFSLHAKVADFINNCRWDLPVNFVRAFPHLAASIEAIVLPIEPCADHLIWTGAMSGILPAKEAYLWLSSHNASVPWSKVIWDKALQPRKSLVVWKALQSRLLTDEFLQKRGVSLASWCSFCYRYGETVNHLFLTCPFVMALWKWLLHLFNKSSCPFDSMDNIFVGPFVESFSPSSHKLWLLVACNLVWGIWHLRNQIRFDRLVVCLEYAQRWFLSRFKESATACFVSGHSPSSPLIFQLLGFLPLNPSAPKFIRVLWSPPPTGWVKVNIDGSCKASGTGFGGIFRNSEGKVLGAFASNHDQPSSTAAEVLAFLEAIRVAWVRDWKHLWLETDSSLVVHFFSSTSYSIPWSLRTEWRNCLWRIKQMHFVCTHIYREGNCVADMLANFGADNHAYYWWDSLPSWAATAYAKDLVGFPRFRFR